MIIQKLKLTSALLLILLLVFVWVLRSLYLSDFSLIVEKQAMSRATTISRINLLMTELQLSEKSNLKGFSQQLNGVTEIGYWQLLDQNNQLIAAKKLGEPQGFLQNLYSFSDVSKSNLMTLKIYFQAKPPSGMPWSIAVVFACLMLVLGIMAVIYWTLKHTVQIEAYARYLLTDTNSQNKPKLEKLANPVYQVINQLILRNSLLSKDKLELTEQIRKISYVDEVTELGNQLFFKAEFQVRLHNHEENESGLFMLLSFVEHDHLDQLVLTDEVLKSIASLLRTFVHSIPNALVARLRANDFALLLPSRSKEETDQICKTLINQLDKSIFDNTPNKEHFMEIGISIYRQGFAYYKIVAEADMALRNAQLQGGNNWYTYGEALTENKIRGHLRWKNFLQNVLDKRLLKLFGQQIVIFNQPELYCQEVLARIEDGKDLLTADTFLPMANQCGLAAEFDRQVVNGVINQSLNQQAGATVQIYSMNLFISSLLDEKFVSWLVKKLSSYPLLCRQFIFEIQERHINQHLPELQKIMPQLANVGISWCVEHFGSPDEAIDYLNLLPIKSVKIDRRVIYDVSENSAQQLLLKSLVINLKSRDIQVLAEGVEKPQDADFIKKSGLDGAQGFYFSQPKRLKNLESHLRAV